MKRRGFLGVLSGAAASLGIVPAAQATETGAGHRVALQVDDNDAGTMNVALHNAGNVLEHYAAAGGPASVEIVAYGPGLHMFRADTSPVKAPLAAFQAKNPGVVLSACDNTKRGMEKTEGKTIELLPGVRIVPSGVVRLMELQEQGWSYIRV
jgi:uncharacterized protein